MSRQLILLLLVVVATCDEDGDGEMVSSTQPAANGHHSLTSEGGNFSTNVMPDRPYRDVYQFGYSNGVTRLRDHKDLWDCRPFPQIVYFDPDPEGKTYAIPAIRIDKCGSAWLKKGLTCDATNQEIVTYEVDLIKGGSALVQLYKDVTCAWMCKKKVCDSNKIFNESSCSCECRKEDRAKCPRANFNTNTCECKCVNLRCGRTKVLDEKECKCVYPPNGRPNPDRTIYYKKPTEVIYPNVASPEASSYA